MANIDIRAEILKSGLRMWRIAEHLNFSDSAFSRYLRHELPELEKERIRTAICELSAMRQIPMQKEAL